MTRKPATKHSIVQSYGEIDVDLIEMLYGYELKPGTMVLTEAALAHVKMQHPNDWARCLPHVGTILADPTYLGDDAKNVGKIEFIGRMPGGEGLLVAVTVTRSTSGAYHVTSFYPVSQTKIDTRRGRNLLKNVVRK